MKHKYFILIFLFLIQFTNLFAQERKQVLGKVVSKSRDLEGIYVENISSRKSTTTEKGGYFKIEIQQNDTLIFASVNLKGVKRVINDTDFSKRLLFIPMEVSPNVLEELIIDRRITSESLGFAAKKKYTPAERQLYTATSSGGGIIPIDAIVNAISGRTAMLKKALAYEREEMLVKKIVDSFDENYFIDELHIPKKHIEGFGYYLAQDPNIVNAINSVNQNQLRFMMSERAAEYTEIIKVLENEND